MAKFEEKRENIWFAIDLPYCKLLSPAKLSVPSALNIFCNAATVPFSVP